jgi:hypothetical protein
VADVEAALAVAWAHGGRCRMLSEPARAACTPRCRPDGNTLGCTGREPTAVATFRRARGPAGCSWPVLGLLLGACVAQCRRGRPPGPQPVSTSGSPRSTGTVARAPATPTRWSRPPCSTGWPTRCTPTRGSRPSSSTSCSTRRRCSTTTTRRAGRSRATKTRPGTAWCTAPALGWHGAAGALELKWWRALVAQRLSPGGFAAAHWNRQREPPGP